MSSIFLSHNHKDKPFVRRLSEKLQSHGVRTWVDEAEMQIGDSLLSKIEFAIKEFTYLGVILSPSSISSEWVRREVNLALTDEIQGRRVKVLPLLHVKCEIPGFLADKIYADFTEDFNDGFEKLLARLQSDLHEEKHKQKRALEILQISYQDWISFEKQEGYLLDRNKTNLTLEYFTELTPSLDLLEYILYSISNLISNKYNDEKLDLRKLKEWIRELELGDVISLFGHVLECPAPRIRKGVILIVEQTEETRALNAIGEHLTKETDSDVRRSGVRCISRLQNNLPNKLSRFLLDNDEDWVVQSYALRGHADFRNCLLISDGSEFATELGELAQKAGFNLISTPPSFLTLYPIDDFDTILKTYELLILVRGEHFTQYGNENFYKTIRDFVRDGGRLFATSWASWETKYQYEFSSVLPFKHIKDTYMENIPIDCQPTKSKLSSELFKNPVTYISSIELLQTREDSTILFETRDGIPIFGYRPFSNGTCYYFNTCQHSCLSFMKSPLQNNPELLQSIQRVFSWIYKQNLPNISS